MKPDGQEGGGFWSTGLGYLTQVGVVLGAVGAIAGGVAALTGSGEPDRKPPAPALDVLDLTVAGGARPVCVGDHPDPPRLDITVRNTGAQPAVITRLGLRVRATGLLTIPGAGGGLEPSKGYDVLLPGEPRIGQLLVYKISQEVGPRASDRFSVRLEQPEPFRQQGVRLYLLDVLLYHDDAETPLETGTALVAAPHLPDKRLFWAGVPSASRPSYRGSPVLATMKDNERTLRRMLAVAGERPPGLDRELVDVPVTDDDEPNPCRAAGGHTDAQAPQQPSSVGDGGP